VRQMTYGAPSHRPGNDVILTMFCGRRVGMI
jgi:hypothetical protein